VRRRHEAAGERHVDDAHAGLQQQLARLVQAKVKVVARRRAAQVLLEQPFELAAREAHGLRELVQAHGLFQVGLHQGDRLHQLRLAGPEREAQRHPLAIVASTDALTEEFFGDGGGERRAVVAAHHVEHEVQRRDAAGTGVAVTVDLEQLLRDDDLGKFLAEAGDVLPVDGAAVSVEEPGAGQRVAGGAQGAQARGPLGEAAQRREQRAVGVLGDALPGAQQHQVEMRGVPRRDVGGEDEAVARMHGSTVHAQDLPLVEPLPRQAVRHAQRLQGGGEGDEGELRHQQEADAAQSLGVAGGRSCLLRCGLLRRHDRPFSSRQRRAAPQG
jgi:hypothetical protein